MSTGGFVLALSGAMSSGKTTLARAIQARTGASRVGFGDLIRHQAEHRGTQACRTALQALGRSLLLEAGAPTFCEMALADAGVQVSDRPVVWDGVRHMEVLRALQAIYCPEPVLLVALAPDESARRRRLSAAAGSPEELAVWETDETESHFDELMSKAGLVCRAATPGEATSEVMRLIAT